MKWHQIDWKKVNLDVTIIQQQIVRAYMNHDYKMVLQLQCKLIRSFSCRAAAVRKIITSSGNKTAGVDGDHHLILESKFFSFDKACMPRNFESVHPET